ncbi:endolytic transglycosylase MltG [Paenarthrobacter sp. CM16]|uniref:endolytic transglycosylase MltG n=1 Tax=Paenarthrobacter sp. CM16 TaxID=2738447 RepID=UPI0015550C11|nr:endolytic transglycosylase MltG [Paenarthrobacter sp. CM16]NQD88214.1 endolytic transglycosylase MltG [Paenarthrobacter sp. CM16]
MSPVNNDPSSGTAGGGMPLTRKELRARERFLATQNHNVVPVPEATPGEAAESTDGEPELPRPVPAVTPAPVTPPVSAAPAAPAAPPVPAAKPATPPIPAAQPVSAKPIPADQPVSEGSPAKTPGETSAVEPEHAGDQQHVAEPEQAVEPENVRTQEDGAAAHGELGGHADLHEVHPGDEHHAGELHHADELHHDGYHHDEHHIEEHHGEELHHDELHHDEHPHDLIAPLEQTASAKAAAKKARRRRRVLALLITLGVFVAAIAIGAQFLKPLLGMDKVTDYPGPGSGSVNITVPEGSGPKAVAVALVENKVVADADAFVKEFLNDGGELSPGEFTFRTEMKNSDAVDVLVNKDSSKVMYFALSAGLRINESLEAISKGSGISLQELNALNQAPAQFGVPSKAKNLEGFLAPGEYRFPLGTPAKDIVQKLVTTTLDELKSQGITEPAKQYDTVTIASIVQAEGGQADYGNVAGAIYNRLKPNNVETSGLIQSDATVTYGLGKKSFHLTEEEKADKSNTYNTYANVGLPAGPIGSPGKTAIDAAAKPTQNDYMYWVTINLDSKETKFSKTLAEHNTYVEQYNAWCQANPGRCV